MRWRIWLLVTAVLVGCAGVNQTREQLPDLAGYNQHEGEAIWDEMSSKGALAALFSGNPGLAATATLVGNVGACAQENEIANWRVYIREDDPLAAGVVVVVSHANASNPALIFQCGQGRPEPDERLSPCADSLSYSTENDTYSVFYAATKQSVCDDFRATFPN